MNYFHYSALSYTSKGKVKSRATLGVTKYGNNGLFSQHSFPEHLTTTWRTYLACVANHSLSKQTWSAYKTAGRMLVKCQEQTNEPMSLPLDDNKVLVFVAWLLGREVTSRTISSYLSGLRQVHLAQGFYIPSLRPILIQQLLTGAANIDILKSRMKLKPIRLPVTVTLMKLLKLEIKESEECKEKKLLLWAVATLCFNGAFRIHELLSKTVRQYDPNFTLLLNDMTVKSIKVGKEIIKTIQVRIKSPKTDRIGVDQIIDVYESNGPLCPVKALLKWHTVSSHKRACAPAFLDEFGYPLTGKKFNRYLKNYMSKYIDYRKGRISSHSFRAGMASLLGNLGFTDEEIQAVGRWNSRAFTAYLKLPRTSRLTMARTIGRLNL